jgi:hypothetical protein
MNYTKIYRDVYNFHDKFRPCPLNDERWQQAAQEAVDIVRDGGNEPFIISMISAVYSEFERVYKARGEK